jgi:sulfoxide reductase catalytic subunit YedY
MTHILHKPSWQLHENQATPEHIFRNRRDFLKTLGMGSLAFAGLSSPAWGQTSTVTIPLPSYSRNPDFADAGRPVTTEELTTTFNNFYEFGFSKSAPAHNARGFSLDPYTLKIGGLVDKPTELDLDQIETLSFQERVYRFRCVEAWGMTVPWLGVPLREIVRLVKPKSTAKYIAFKTFYDPERAVGQKDKRYRWPYYEGLRMDEAMNDLAFVATGHYGKRLVPQSGTPLRIILPWKYGYKGPKSIVEMMFTDTEPKTFWNDANPGEYKFYSNVDPQVSHPRWSQAKERWLGEGTKTHDTEWYNGYGEQVASLYSDMPRKLF